MNIARTLSAAVFVTAAIALTACTSGGSSPSSPSTPGDVITPVTMDVDDLQGETVDLQVGQVLNITTGDLDVASYTGEVSDSDVAIFVAGRTDGSAEFNPGVEAVGEGTAEVTMTNSDGGIEPLEFTVVVRAE